jgi:branched-chain amino acid transport system ATP-binding protein
MAEALLCVEALNIRYGGIHAVKGVDLQVREGEHVTLIGANGAGKTSTLKAITRLLPAAGGDIRFNGQSLLKTPAHALPALGMAMVPEGRGIFARMSVLENLYAGAYLRGDRTAVARDITRLFDHFPCLAQRRGQTAGLLSGGEQQMLALSRALLTRPRLLLLDEPSMGLAPVVVETIFKLIEQLCRDGMTLLLVEQNARLALQATERAYVMDSGLITANGASAALFNDAHIRVAYLGE